MGITVTVIAADTTTISLTITTTINVTTTMTISMPVPMTSAYRITTTCMHMTTATLSELPCLDPRLGVKTHASMRAIYLEAHCTYHLLAKCTYVDRI